MKEDHNQLVGYFHKHIVPIYAILKKKEMSVVYTATAFIPSVDNHWFLTTAGHVAEGINELLTDPSYQMQDSFLYDYGGLEAKYRQPIPFNLTEKSFTIIGNNTTLDYAVIYLGEHFKDLLQANRVEALNEASWRYQPKDPDFHFLLGVPKNELSVEWQDDAFSIISNIKITTTMHPVKYSPDRPKGLDLCQYPRWYGHVFLPPSFKSIKGISGGPIFAFKKLSDGNIGYWLVGIQSSWNRETKAIAACPANILGESLNYIIRAAYKNHVAMG